MTHRTRKSLASSTIIAMTLMVTPIEFIAPKANAGNATQTAGSTTEPAPRCTYNQVNNCDAPAQIFFQTPYITGRIVKDAYDTAKSNPIEILRDILYPKEKAERLQKIVDESEEIRKIARNKCLDLIGCDYSPRKRTKKKVSGDVPVEPDNSEGISSVASKGVSNGGIQKTNDYGNQLDSYGYEFESYEPEHFAWYDYADDDGIHTQSVDTSTYGESGFGSDDPFGLDFDELDTFFNSDASDFYEGEAFNKVWEEAEASRHYDDVQVEDAEQRTAAQEFFGDFDDYSDDDYSDDYEDRKFRDLETARFEEIRRELESLESALRNNEKAHFGKNVRQMLSDQDINIRPDGSHLGEPLQPLMPNSSVNRTPNRKDPRERAVRQPSSYRDNPNLIYSPVASPDSIKKRRSPPQGRRCMECTS